MAKHRPPARLSNLPRHRPGEGSSVLDVKFDTFIATDGTSTAQLGLDVSKAAVPDRRYAADTCALEYVNQIARIIFAQERFDGQGLRSAIAIRMPPRAVLQTLHSLSASVPPSLVDKVLAEGAVPQPLSSAKLEPSEATAVMSANVAIAALSGMEACIDFYEISPFSLAIAIAQGSSATVPVEGVVRVELTSGLLLSIIDGLKAMSQQLPVKLKEPQQ